MSISDWAAWYGAFVATAVFGWELFKWLRSGSRIKIRVTYDMQMTDGTGKLEPQKYFVINAVNIGDQATTVSHLGINYFSTLAGRLFRRPTRRMIVPAPTHAEQLPKLLDPGATWTGAVPQTVELEAMMKEGHLSFGLLNNSKGRSEYGLLKPK